MQPDPNKDRNDPMVPEYWLLGEDLQDKIRAAGYEPPTVEGIAIDLHDLLQSAKRIEEELASGIVAASPADSAKLIELMRALKFEFEHIAWHCGSASEYLANAIKEIEGR
jgi:hypothetical protein